MLPLKNKWIVVTRPVHQAGNLTTLLEKAGANVISFPLLEIKEAKDQRLIQEQLAALAKYDLAVFISPNAVEFTLKQLSISDFKSMKIAAVGKKTASLLGKYGLKVDFFPAGVANSEALLEMPDLRQFVTDKKVVVFRGNGGRELIKDTLQELGAKVEYINIYRRCFPHSDLRLLEDHINRDELDIILISSGNSLKNLYNFQGQYDWLKSLRLLAGSERIKKQILAISGFKGEVLSADDPADEKIYQQLLKWASRKDINHG